LGVDTDVLGTLVGNGLGLTPLQVLVTRLAELDISFAQKVQIVTSFASLSVDDQIAVLADHSVSIAEVSDLIDSIRERADVTPSQV
jgi:hypothetical protein